MHQGYPNMLDWNLRSLQWETQTHVVLYTQSGNVWGWVGNYIFPSSSCNLDFVKNVEIYFTCMYMCLCVYASTFTCVSQKTILYNIPQVLPLPPFQYWRLNLGLHKY